MTNKNSHLKMKPVIHMTRTPASLCYRKGKARYKNMQKVPAAAPSPQYCINRNDLLAGQIPS